VRFKTNHFKISTGTNINDVDVYLKIPQQRWNWKWLCYRLGVSETFVKFLTGTEIFSPNSVQTSCGYHLTLSLTCFPLDVKNCVRGTTIINRLLMDWYVCSHIPWQLHNMCGITVNFLISWRNYLITWQFQIGPRINHKLFQYRQQWNFAFIAVETSTCLKCTDYYSSKTHGSLYRTPSLIQ